MKSQHREKNIVKLAEKIPASIPGDKKSSVQGDASAFLAAEPWKGRAGGAPETCPPERRQGQKNPPPDLPEWKKMCYNLTFRKDRTRPETCVMLTKATRSDTNMLELKGLTYQVGDNGGQTDILRGLI